MSALTFPLNPFNGQLYPTSPLPGEIQYQYEAASNTWRLLGAASGVIPGTYGSPTKIPIIEVNATGIILNIVETVVQSATTTQPGLVQLVNDTVTADTTKALTAAMGKSLQDQINAGSGTVTQVQTGTGLSGGPITTSGTINLLPPAGGNIGGVKAGSNITITSDGTISALTNSGTVTQVNTGLGLAGGPITTSGTVSLKPATSSTIGGVKPDGTTLFVTSDGTLFSTTPGTVTSVDVTGGTGITTSGGPVTNSGVITVSLTNTTVSAGTYTNSTITVDSQGRVTNASSGTGPTGTVTQVDTGLGLTGGPITTSGIINLAPATTTVIGGVIPDGITLSVQSSGRVSVRPATTSTLGGVIPDGTTITVQPDGTISTTGAGSAGTLQEVTDNGATTTNKITAAAITLGDDFNGAPSLAFDGSSNSGLRFNVLTGEIEVVDGGIQVLTTSDSLVTSHVDFELPQNINLNANGPVNLRQAGGEARFYDVDNTNYVGFVGPATASSNLTWRLPDSDGTIGQVLTTDGASTLSWSSVASATVTNVKQYGAVGNGSTDDTSAIQSAIDSTDGIVFFPEGNYLVSGNLSANKKVKLMGSGFGSKITYNGTGTLLTLSYSDGTQNGPQYEIESLSFYNGGAVSDCCIELRYTGPNGILGGDDKLHLTNVLIHSASYWKKGLFLNRAGGVYAVNTSIINNNNATAEATPGVYGVHVLNDLANHNQIRCFSAANFYVQRFYRCIYFEVDPVANACETLYVVNAELLGGTGVYLEGEIGAVSLANTHFDTIDAAVYAPETSVIRLTGCDMRFGRNGVYGTPGVTLGSTSGLGQQGQIIGCNFIGNNNTMLSIEGGTGWTVVGNNFLGGNSNTIISVQNNASEVFFASNNAFNYGTLSSVTSTGADITIGESGTFSVGTATFVVRNGIVASIT